MVKAFGNLAIGCFFGKGKSPFGFVSVRMFSLRERYIPD